MTSPVLGADLYESYCGSILATAALGAAAFVSSGSVELQYKAVVAPMLIAAVGIILSIIGIFAVRTNENANDQATIESLSHRNELEFVLIAISTFRDSLCIRHGEFGSGSVVP